MNPSHALTAEPPSAASQQTRVELYWLEGRSEHWLRFGSPISDTILDRRRRRLIDLDLRVLDACRAVPNANELALNPGFQFCDT